MSESFKKAKYSMGPSYFVETRQEILAILSSAGLDTEKSKRIGHFINDLVKLEGEDELIIKSLKTVIEIMTDPTTNILIAQEVLNEMLSHLIHLNYQVSKPVSIYFLEKTQPRVTSFEKHVAEIRQHLSTVYENDEEFADFRKAAEVLMGINLESSQSAWSASYKVFTYVHIALLLLQDNDAVTAESYMLRASQILPKICEANLKFYYTLCYAVILDYRKKFLEAAVKYLDLYINNLDNGEAQRVLRHAVICTILSPLGKPKSRLLAALFKLRPCSQLPEGEMLAKMHFQKFIQKPELQDFKILLESHHTAIDTAVIENNLIFVSKAYKNIRIEHLGELLGVTPLEAERAVAELIRKEHINGSIDRVDYIVTFECAEDVEQFDDQIREIASKLESMCALAKEAEANIETGKPNGN